MAFGPWLSTRGVRNTEIPSRKHLESREALWVLQAGLSGEGGRQLPGKRAAGGDGTCTRASTRPRPWHLIAVPMAQARTGPRPSHGLSAPSPHHPEGERFLILGQGTACPGCQGSGAGADVASALAEGSHSRPGRTRSPGLRSKQPEGAGRSRPGPAAAGQGATRCPEGPDSSESVSGMPDRLCRSELVYFF